MTKKNIGILIVDDELSVRDSLSRWFEEDGYRVGAASDATEALKNLKSDSFCTLCDEFITAVLSDKKRDYDWQRGK